MESTDDAIVGKTLAGTILSWNAAAERIFGWKAEEILGRNIRTLIPLERFAEEDRIIDSITRGERVPTFETIRQRKDGSQINIAVTVSPVSDPTGKVIAASKIARDITERHLFEEKLRLSEERFRLLADHMSQLAWIADSSGSIFWYNQRWFDYTGTDLEEMKGWGWQKVHHPDFVDKVTERFEQHIASGEDWEDTFPLRGAAGEWRWFLSRAKPIRDESGNIIYWFGTNTDVTEMRDAEQRIELLLQEVNHRSKNMLAIIQSLARRSDANRPDFIERLEQRIRGLAANQDLLVRGAWSPVPAREMIEAQLRSLGDSRSQIGCEGPEVLLSPGAAEALAMAFHEMATNAMKYGALSVPEGRVTVRWGLEGLGSDEMFHIEWIECDGPPAKEPTHRGFGSRIIVDVPRVKLNARISIDYPPEGFQWRLECRAASIA